MHHDFSKYANTGYNNSKCLVSGASDNYSSLYVLTQIRVFD